LDFSARAVAGDVGKKAVYFKPVVCMPVLKKRAWISVLNAVSSRVKEPGFLHHCMNGGKTTIR